MRSRPSWLHWHDSGGIVIEKMVIVALFVFVVAAGVSFLGGGVRQAYCRVAAVVTGTDAAACHPRDGAPGAETSSPLSGPQIVKFSAPPGQSNLNLSVPPAP